MVDHNCSVHRKPHKQPQTVSKTERRSKVKGQGQGEGEGQGQMWVKFNNSYGSW